MDYSARFPGQGRRLFKSVEDPRAVATLVAARVVYAINWLNVGAIFVLMSSDLGVSVAGLGTLTAAFYLGVGIMQVPGGVMTAKWGAKKVVVFGIFLSTAAVFATSAGTSILEIAVLRFIVGTGMAFVFAPGVVLVSELFRGGKSGMGVGLFNSAFDIGGVVALFGWVVLAEASGWRPSLLIGGVLSLVTGILVLLFVPSDKGRAAAKASRGVVLRLLAHRQLILLGAATLGFQMCNTILSGFMVEYLVKSLGESPVTAGVVSSLVTFVPIFTAIWGGAIYDRTSRPRLLMVVALLGSSVALSFAAYPSLWTAIAASSLGGVVAGIGYTFAFAAARDVNREGREYDTLAIGWVNGISLTGSFVPSIIYSTLVVTAGYQDAWLGCALLTLVFLVPLLALKEKFSN